MADITVLKPVNLLWELKNATGSVIPNGAPGIVFQFELLPFTPQIQIAARQLLPSESPSKWGVQVTGLTPGQTNVNFRASVGVAGQNSVTAQIQLSASGGGNMQPGTITVA